MEKEKAKKIAEAMLYSIAYYLKNEVDYSKVVNFLVDVLHWDIQQVQEVFSELEEEKIPWCYTKGKIYPFGGSSHHSGHANGEVILLPNDKWAIIMEYSSEILFGGGWESGRRLVGVTEGLRLPESFFSAKQTQWQGEKLIPPTEEEIKFINIAYQKIGEEIEPYEA